MKPIPHSNIIIYTGYVDIFPNAIGYTPKTESKSDKVLPMETQLNWLREIGFVDVDCYWKWLEMALLIGYKV